MKTHECGRTEQHIKSCQTTVLYIICILINYYGMVSHLHEYYYNSLHISNYNLG